MSVSHHGGYYRLAALAALAALVIVGLTAFIAAIGVRTMVAAARDRFLVESADSG